MDPALHKEHQAFLKKARSVPMVQKQKPLPGSSYSGSNSQPTSGPSSYQRSKPEAVPFDYKTAIVHPKDQARFSILSKIVKYMRERHVEGNTHPLSVDDILDETSMNDISRSIRIWLETEALPNNPKITCIDGKYTFKPKYNIRNRRELFHLLRRHDMQGLGGIYKDDIAESLNDVDKALQVLGENVTQIVRPHDKKVVLFYNDRTFDLKVNEDFKKLWRSCTVDNMDDAKIEEYLQKNGISSMSGDKKAFTPATKTKRCGKRKRGPIKLRDNEHLASSLQDFSTQFEKN